MTKRIEKTQEQLEKEAFEKAKQEVLQAIATDFEKIDNATATKQEYIKGVQSIATLFVKEYNGLLSYNSDILARLVQKVEKYNKADLQKLGAFFIKYTTIKSVSIKKPSDFTTTEYIFKNGKKYKTVAFKEGIDIENLPLWYDCKHEKKTQEKPVAKKLLTAIKGVLNTVDAIENDTQLLAISNDFYKLLDTASAKLEQIINNQ